MKTTELLEQMQAAFYDVVDVAEQNLPEMTYDADDEEVFKDQLDQYNNAIAQFQKTYKELMARTKEKS